MIGRLRALIRQRIAARRLQRMVEATRETFEHKLFLKNRDAQLQRRGRA